MWAENILRGREQLVIQYLLENYKGETEELTLSNFLTELEALDDGFCVLANHRTFPWHVASTHIRHEKSGEGPNKTYIGNCRILYNHKYIDKGKAIILPVAGMNWNVVNKLEVPEISLIEPDSEEGKRIQVKNPEMDISQKVLINSREIGFVDSNIPLEEVRFIEVTGLDENDE
jgi:hypothetical protein